MDKSLSKCVVLCISEIWSSGQSVYVYACHNFIYVLSFLYDTSEFARYNFKFALLEVRAPNMSPSM